MDSYQQYNNRYPVYPNYVDADAIRAIDPGLYKQHMEDNVNFQEQAAPTSSVYQSAPPMRRSTMMEGMPGNAVPSRVNTFVLEDVVFHIKNRVDNIFYIMIVLVILVIFIVICNMVMVLSVSIITKR